MSKRVCKAKTKRGTKCKTPPMKGETFCMAHAPQDLKASKGFGGSRAGAMGGRPRMPTPSEIKRQLLERYELVAQKPYWQTLGYDVKIGENGDPELVELPDGGAKVYGESKDGDIVLSDVEDLGAQIEAVEKLENRVYGRPKQATEITSPDGSGLVLIAPPDAGEKARKAAELLQDLGRLDATR